MHQRTIDRRTAKLLAAIDARMVALLDMQILSNDKLRAMATRGLLSAPLRATRESQRRDPIDRPLLKRQLRAFLKVLQAQRRRLRQERTDYLRTSRRRAKPSAKPARAL